MAIALHWHLNCALVIGPISLSLAHSVVVSMTFLLNLKLPKLMYMLILESSFLKKSMQHAHCEDLETGKIKTAQHIAFDKDMNDVKSPPPFAHFLKGEL